MIDHDILPLHLAACVLTGIVLSALLWHMLKARIP